MHWAFINLRYADFVLFRHSTAWFILLADLWHIHETMRSPSPLVLVVPVLALLCRAGHTWNIGQPWCYKFTFDLPAYLMHHDTCVGISTLARMTTVTCSLFTTGYFLLKPWNPKLDTKNIWVLPDKFSKCTAPSHQCETAVYLKLRFSKNGKEYFNKWKIIWGLQT